MRISGALAAMALWGAAQAVAARCSLPEAGEPLAIPKLADAAAECLGEGRAPEAAKIFYAMQLRARALAEAAGPGPWRRQAERLQAQIGAPANRAMGGNIPAWAAAMEWALAWEAASPWPDAAIAEASPGQVAAALGRQRAELRKAASDAKGLDKGRFYAARAKAGLPVDEPGWGPPPASEAGRPAPGGRR